MNGEWCTFAQRSGSRLFQASSANWTCWSIPPSSHVVRYGWRLSLLRGVKKASVERRAFSFAVSAVNGGTSGGGAEPAAAEAIDRVCAREKAVLDRCFCARHRLERAIQRKAHIDKSLR